jgi:hypothetical protein
MKPSKLKKGMSSGSCLTSKLYDKFIKMLSKSHETVSLKRAARLHHAVVNILV